MNLDLLTKLVRLANNNPNDNEANLAARRACKLIEEGKFQFGVDSSKTNTKPSPNVNQHVPNNPADWFRRYYTEQRQQQQYQYQSQYKCKGCGTALDYLDAVSSGYCYKCRKQQEERENNNKYDWSKTKIKFDFNDHNTYKPADKPQENITVKCLFCKQDFKRKTFTIDFICHQCYVKKNKSEKPPIRDDRTTTYYKSVFCFACGHGFTITYTELESEQNKQIIGNCEKCKAQYIRVAT